MRKAQKITWRCQEPIASCYVPGHVFSLLRQLHHLEYTVLTLLNESVDIVIESGFIHLQIIFYCAF